MSAIQNRVAFSVEYKKNLLESLTKNPADYAWPASEVNDVVDRMMTGLMTGGANTDSPAIRRTCKTLGIKHQIGAIKRYLNGETI